MATLYIVATPIGNLEDISLRALRILKEVDLIACEDTRVTKKLLFRYQIKTPTISYHQHSRPAKIDYLVNQLKTGKSLALVSDSGTPAISDPGAKLISKAIGQLKDKLKIVPVPGPSALVAAASISGLPADRFIFLGFLPHKKGKEKFFKSIAEAGLTVIFYESSHRILKTLEKLKEVLDKKRQIVVCRELTKKFETVIRGPAEEAAKEVKKGKIKGEFVLVIEGRK